MKSTRFPLALVFLALSGLLPGQSNTADKPEPIPPADAQAVAFLRACSGCHTIGRGKLTGPDLVSARAMAQGTLDTALERMRPRVIGSFDAAALSALLRDGDAPARLEREQQRQSRLLEAKLDPPDARLGAALFSGHRKFASGGPACASCHSIGVDEGLKAPFLGPDLRGVYKRYGRDSLRTACEQPGFRVMAGVYKDHPVTRQEAFHLVAYFASVDQAPWAKPGVPLVPLLLGAALLFFGAMALYYRRRLRSVRRQITEAAR